MNNSTTAPCSPQQTVSSERLDRDPASRNSIQALHKNLAKQHFANLPQMRRQSPPTNSASKNAVQDGSSFSNRTSLCGWGLGFGGEI